MENLQEFDHRNNRFPVTVTQETRNFLDAQAAALNMSLAGCAGLILDYVAQTKMISSAHDRALQHLRRYANCEHVSDVIADDEQLANTLQELIGPTFKYLDWADKSIGEIRRQYDRE